MKTHRNLSRRIGKALGRAWWAWLRLENWLSSLIKKIGISAIATKIVLRLLLAAGIVKLMYVSGFLTLLGAFLAVGILIVVLAYVLANWTYSENYKEDEKMYMFGEDDPRNKMGYDPVFYNDYGDPNYPPEKELN